MTADIRPEHGYTSAAPTLGATRAAPPPAARERSGFRSPVVQGLLALACYSAVWLATSAHSMFLDPARAQLDQRSMDPNFYAWCLRWWPYAISHGLNPLFTRQIGAPAGHSLAWVTTVPPLALLAAPITLAASPVTAFNLLVVAAMPLAAWAAFLLCRRLTGSFWASLAGGAVFGFSAYEMNHTAAGQLNLTYSLLMPILAYLVVIWWQGSISARTFIIAAAVTMATQCYLFLETFADMTAVLIVSLLVGIALAGKAWRPAIFRAARYLGAAYLLGVAAALPYLLFALSTKPPHLVAVSNLDLTSLILPRPDRVFGIPWLMHIAKEPAESSAAGYLGIPLLVLMVLLAVTTWSNRLVRFLACMVAFIIAASLGTYLYILGSPVARLPWGAVWNLPLLRSAYPSRLMLFAYLALAVATSLWVAGPARRTWSRWPLVLVVLAFVALDAPPIAPAVHTTVPSFVGSGMYRRVLKPGEIVLVVSRVGNAGMLWQAETGFYFRLSGGYINQMITPYSDLPPVVRDLARPTSARVATFESWVRREHIGAILVDVGHVPYWTSIFRRIGLVGVRYGHVIVYLTRGCSACAIPHLSDHSSQLRGLTRPD